MKHSKFLEALGLALLLVSWALEWNNYKEYEVLITSFKDSVESIQGAYAVNYEAAQINLQSAITRAIIISNRQKVLLISGENISDESWKSIEVKTEWVYRLIQNISAQELFLRLYNGLNSKYGFGIESILNDQRKKLDELRKPLDRAGPIKYNQLYSAPVDLSAKDAFAVDLCLQPIAENDLNIRNEIFRAIDNRKTKWAFYYKFMYLIGTILIIFPKLFEWWVGLKEKNQTILEENNKKRRE